jgi:hypothetical protein
MQFNSSDAGFRLATRDNEQRVNLLTLIDEQLRKPMDKVYQPIHPDDSSPSRNYNKMLEKLNASMGQIANSPLVTFICLPYLR